jgi:hypothetical protein
MRLWHHFPSPSLRNLLARERSVALHCEACGHEAKADLRRLIRDHGTETTVSRLPFVCSCCGGRQVAVKAA